MHPYLVHLLADIAAAHRTEIPCTEQGEQSFEEQMEEIEKWVGGDEGDYTFGYYCGLQSANFPPPDQLTNEEMKMVITAFHSMMFSWNLDIHLPDALPVSIAYKMTVDTLDSKTMIVNSGTINFDFCSGNAPDCIFKEYCPCLRYWNEISDEPLQSESFTNDADDDHKSNPPTFKDDRAEDINDDIPY